MREPERRLTPLFDPRSVAVLGASGDAGKWGGIVARKLLAGRDRRDVYLVNRRGESVLGEPTYTSVADVPEVPELAVVVVPRAGFAESVRECLERGTKAIIAITAGFAEIGAAGATLQEEVVGDIRAAGAVMLGPNCNGLFDAGSGLDCMAWSQPPSGSVAVISQSGSVIIDFAKRAAAFGLGISRGISVGNQADLTLADLIPVLVEHQLTDRIVVYVEDVREGRALFQQVEAAVAAGTPVVVLAARSGVASARAARSHTGALLSDHRVLNAACEASGAVLVTTLREAAEVAHVMGAPTRAQGRRTAVMSDTGGLGVMAASEAEAADLEVPVLSSELQARLAKQFAPGAGVANPVDAVGIEDVDWVIDAAEELMASAEVDLLLVNATYFDQDSPEAEERLGARFAGVLQARGKPSIVCTLDQDSPAVAALRDAGVPVVADVEVGMRGLACLVERPRPGVPALRPASKTLPQGIESYFGARRLLEEYGVAFSEAREVVSVDEAVRAAEAIGWPVVVKALGLLHKSDAGGVALNVDSPAAVRAALEDIGQRVNPEGFAVEEMVESADSVELIVGGVRDPRFGPLVMVGAGGIYTEILGDTAVGLAPTNVETARSVLGSLDCAPLLNGARGRAPLDVTAAARTIVAISEVISDHPELAELEINPLLVQTSGVVGLDARALRTDASIAEPGDAVAVGR